MGHFICRCNTAFPARVGDAYIRSNNMDIRYLDNALTGETLASFRNQAGWGATPLPQAQKAVQNTLFSVVAYDGDIPVGIGRLVGDGAINWYIQDLIVLAAYQNHGVGSKIIDQLMNFASQNSVPDSVVTIALMAAKGKEEFYQKFGFLARPNEQQGAGMMMKKKIY